MDVRVGPAALQGHFEIESIDGDGEPVTFPVRRVERNSQAVSIVDGRVALEANQSYQIHASVQLGRLDAPLLVRFLDKQVVISASKFTAENGDISRAFPLALPSQTRLYLVIGPNLGIVTSEDKAVATQFDPSASHVVKYQSSEELRELSDSEDDYDSVDALIVNATNREWIQSLGERGILAAWERHCQLGGKLVLFLGEAGADLLANQGPLAVLAPGEFRDVVPLPSPRSIEVYAGAKNPLDFNRASLASRPQVCRLKDVRGKIELFEGPVAAELPLVVRSPHGLGEIVFVALDLEHNAFAKWEDRTRFVSKLLRLRDYELKPRQQTGNVMALPYNDMSGQLRAALTEFPGARAVPFSWVALLTLAYAAIVGPLDYLLCHRVLKRPEWTWGTFLGMSVCFGAAVSVLAVNTKGTQPYFNQISVLDIDAEGKVLRGGAWFSTFSPKAESLDLELASAPSRNQAPQAVRFSWWGLPGAAFNGIDTFSAPMLATKDYRLNFPDQISAASVPIQSWSTKSLNARWQEPCEETDFGELTVRGNKLVGRIRNSLSFSLTEAKLLYADRCLRLGNLPARSVVRIDGDTSSVSILNEYKETQFQDMRQIDKPYNRLSRDPRYVLERMTVFDAILGKEYCNLYQRFAPHFDLSHMLASDRALLIGFSEDPSAGILIQHKTNSPSSDRASSKSTAPSKSAAGESNSPEKPQGHQLTMVRVVIPLLSPANASGQAWLPRQLQSLTSLESNSP